MTPDEFRELDEFRERVLDAAHRGIRCTHKAERQEKMGRWLREKAWLIRPNPILEAMIDIHERMASRFRREALEAEAFVAHADTQALLRKLRAAQLAEETFA